MVLEYKNGFSIKCSRITCVRGTFVIQILIIKCVPKCNTCFYKSSTKASIFFLCKKYKFEQNLFKNKENHILVSLNFCVMIETNLKI